MSAHVAKTGNFHSTTFSQSVTAHLFFNQLFIQLMSSQSALL